MTPGRPQGSYGNRIDEYWYVGVETDVDKIQKWLRKMKSKILGDPYAWHMNVLIQPEIKSGTERFYGIKKVFLPAKA